AAQGDLLFVAIFGAACAMTIIEAIRRLRWNHRARGSPSRDPRLALPPPASRFTAGAAGFFALDPVARAATAIRRAETLRHDPLVAELARKVENDLARLSNVMIQLQRPGRFMKELG